MTINQCAVCGHVDTTGTLQICPKCKSPMPNQKGRKIKPPKSQPSAAQQPTGYPGGTGAPQPSRSKKPIGLIAGVALGAVALAIAAFFVVSALFGTNVLGAAAENSLAALSDQLSQQNNLFTYMAGMNSLDAQSHHHILFGVTTPDVYLSLDTDYAGSKKLMTGTIQYKHLHDSTELSVDFHANKKEVRIYAPGLVSDVYGFTYKNFEKKYDSSSIRKLLNLPTFENMDLSPFQGFDLIGYLEDQGGDSWDAFVDSVKLEEFDTREITLGSRTEECTIHRIKWDTKKAERLIQTISKKSLGAVPDFIMDLASNLSPDVRCYVNSNDTLVGIDFTFLNSIYTFLLEGENNPWEQVSLKIITAGAEPRVYSGGVYTEGADTRIEVKASDQTVYAIYHNSTTGIYSVVSPMGEFSNGIYRADDSGFHLESNFHNFSYVLSVTDLYTIPEQADEKYIELTDLSFSEASRMMTELCSSFGITLESFLEQLGELFGG